MSKRDKKRRDRNRAPGETTAGTPEAGPAPPQTPPQPVDAALLARVAAAAEAVGNRVEEGDRVLYLYNGETLAIKYVASPEPSALVAAFRLGVVFQVEGDRQLRYAPGDWEEDLARLAGRAPAEPTYLRGAGWRVVGRPT